MITVFEVGTFYRWIYHCSKASRVVPLELELAVEWEMEAWVRSHW